ncbi:MAG: type II toxin-antitoxin system prevent-host-death family antitoxin [Leptospiraceae bacterium]|nr:type II toxin-antitoxin system prevent-host-death family antitoxin [Leptospiraceae bacterium]MCK6380425.1 type II toxin-antitoxin system prevent-host-death family antitoxin [Leptospiraceae bacterium]NUM41907.1 type II toxin-antitoxin system prevent-host-death family antitoxin [Leptospiraceae bacterium]
MLSVGIRELKSHLSQYIDLVKKGENIVITEHNKIVAEIKIPQPQSSIDKNLKKVFNKLVADGTMIPPKQKTHISSNRKNKKNLIKRSEWWNIYQDSKED